MEVKKKILVVDDNPNNNAIAEELLGEDLHSYLQNSYLHFSNLPFSKNLSFFRNKYMEPQTFAALVLHVNFFNYRVGCKLI